MREDFRYPDTLSQQLLYGGGFRGQTPNQYGTSPGDILAGGLGSIDWGSLFNNVGNIFGGGGNTGTYQGTWDGIPLGYDAAPPAGPKGYWDSAYYNSALNEANKAFAAKAAAAAAGKNTMAPALIAALMQLLGGGKKGSPLSFGGGGGPGGGNQQGKAGKPAPLQKSPFFSQEHNVTESDFAKAMGLTYDPQTDTFTSPYGQQFSAGDVLDNPEFYQTNPNLPNIPFAGGSPSNPWDIFPDRGSNPPGSDTGGGGGGMPPSWYNDNLDVNQVPTDFGSTDFSGGDWS
jgi:hypothetical protein